MKVEIHDKPWKHAIIDDLLPQNIFDKLLNFALEYNKNGEWVKLNRYTNLSKHKAAFYQYLCHTMTWATNSKQEIRMAQHD